MKRLCNVRQVYCFGLLVLVVLGGCASYTPHSVQVPRIEAMSALGIENEITVGADPYVQPDRQDAVFDGDLRKAGILPIQILLQNNGDRRLLVRRSNITLVLPDGRQISPVGATAVAVKVPPKGGGWGYGLGFYGLVAESMAADKARQGRVADYRNKELQDVTLVKGESAHGFIYFVPPQETPTFTKATLMVPVVDVELGTSFVVRLQLSGLGL